MDYPHFEYGHQAVYPIKKVGSRAQLTLDALRQTTGASGELWLLHQAIFRARMEALKVMIRDGYQPVDEPTINVIIEISQNAVTDAAGDVGSIPADAHHVTVHRHGVEW